MSARNPSSTTLRTATLKPFGNRVGQAPQQRFRVEQSQVPRNLFQARNLSANPIGPDISLPGPTPSTTITMNTDSTTKRRGIDSIVLQGGSKRGRVDLGGNNPRELAALRRTQLGRTPTRPIFNDAVPEINNMRRGINGMPVANRMPEFRNPLPLDSSFDRTEGPGNIIIDGMHRPLPSVARMTPATGPSTLEGTRTNNQFMRLSDGTARLGNGPDPVELFNNAAADIEKKTKSGSPNARITYTHTLNEIAAAYAGVTQEKTIWILPIIFEIGGMGYDGHSGNLFNFGVDVQHAGYNLAIANYMMAISQPFPQNLAEVVTVQAILSSFKYAGIVAAEEGATKSQYVDQSDAHIHRNIVFTVQGEADVFNYWGDVKYGGRVGLIVKGVNTKNIFAHNYLDVGSYNIDGVEPAAIRVLDKLMLSSNPIQFIPWFDDEGMADEPSPAELEYRDDYGILRSGVYIPVGTVLQVFGEVANMSQIERAWVSAAATYKAGLIRILVDTQNQLF